MTKKVLIGILVSILLSLFTSFCFASTNDINLGNDISSSIDKSMHSVRNVARDVTNSTHSAIQDMGSMDNARNNNDNTRINNGTNNLGGTNYGTGTTGSASTNYGVGANGSAGTNYGNYGTTRTTTEGTNASTGMSTTTWMWVIFAIAAIIIIAAIWYYAMQGNDRS